MCKYPLIGNYPNSHQTEELDTYIKGGTSLKHFTHFTQSQLDRIVSNLESYGGSASRSMLARRTKLKQHELDSILEELELEGVIKRTRLRTGYNGPPRELISLRVITEP